jgi:hypothetical protein
LLFQLARSVSVSKSQGISGADNASRGLGGYHSQRPRGRPKKTLVKCFPLLFLAFYEPVQAFVDSWHKRLANQKMDAYSYTKLRVNRGING